MTAPYSLDDISKLSPETINKARKLIGDPNLSDSDIRYHILIEYIRRYPNDSRSYPFLFLLDHQKRL